MEDNPGTVVTPKSVSILGWRRFVGFPVEGATPSLEALATYLALHDGHHLSADQIALGMWPLGRPRGEMSRKTVHNNLSALRGWVGAEHLPDAAVAGGYLLEGIDSDWATFQRLVREADTVDAEAARDLRTEALGLVRGRPFDGLTGDGYDWIEAEGLLGTVTKAIVTCAIRLGTDLVEAGEYAAAEEAVRAGLLGSPNEYALFELGARAARAGEGAAPSSAGWPRPVAASTPPTWRAFVPPSVTTTPSRSERGKCAAPLRPAGVPCAPPRRGARAIGPPL